MLFQKYVLLCVSAVFLSEYSFGMDKFKNGCIELKDSVSENKKEVALKTVGIGCFGFGTSLGLLKLNEESDKKTDLVEVIKKNKEILVGASAVGAFSGFVWGVHSSAKKSTAKKSLQKDIITLKSKIEKIKIDPCIKDDAKEIKIEIIQEILDEKEKELEELK